MNVECGHWTLKTIYCFRKILQEMATYGPQLSDESQTQEIGKASI